MSKILLKTFTEVEGVVTNKYVTIESHDNDLITASSYFICPLLSITVFKNAIPTLTLYSEGGTPIPLIPDVVHAFYLIDGKRMRLPQSNSHSFELQKGNQFYFVETPLNGQIKKVTIRVLSIDLLVQDNFAYPEDFPVSP